jgi:hypothetical protein
MADFPSNPPVGEPPAASGASAPAGWYPDGSGGTRWWDGQAWGAPAPVPNPPADGAVSDPKTLAMLCHLLAIFFGFLGPLVMYLVYGDKDPFVRHHAAESLNFQIMLTIGYVISFILMFVLVGFLLLPILIIGGLVLEIIGCLRAGSGEWWRYPINLRLVPGAQG